MSDHGQFFVLHSETVHPVPVGTDVSKWRIHSPCNDCKAWILQQLNKKSLKYNWHEADVTVLEGVFAAGTARSEKWSKKHTVWDVCMIPGAKALTMKNGCRHLQIPEWILSFTPCGNAPWMSFFHGIHRYRRDQKLPKKRMGESNEAQVTPNCRMQCSGCGAAKFGGGVCFEGKN